MDHKNITKEPNTIEITAIVITIFSAIIAYNSSKSAEESNKLQKQGLIQQNSQFNKTLEEARQSRIFAEEQAKKNERNLIFENSSKVFFKQELVKIYLKHIDDKSRHTFDEKNRLSVFPTLVNLDGKVSVNTDLSISILAINGEEYEGNDRYEFIDIGIIGVGESKPINWIPSIIKNDTNHKIKNIIAIVRVTSRSINGTNYGVDYDFYINVNYPSPSFIDIDISSPTCPTCFPANELKSNPASKELAPKPLNSN
jgi:hypothetical protein